MKREEENFSIDRVIDNKQCGVQQDYYDYLLHDNNLLVRNIFTYRHFYARNKKKFVIRYTRDIKLF